MESVPAASGPQEEGRAGALLKRADAWAGEEVRDAEVPEPPREEAAGQAAAAQRETGKHTNFNHQLLQRASS